MLFSSFEFAFEVVSHSVYQHAFALFFVSSPITFIVLFIGVLGYPIALFFVQNKLTLIDIFMRMEVVSLAVPVSRSLNLASPLTKINAAFEVIGKMIVELILSGIINKIAALFNPEMSIIRDLSYLTIFATNCKFI